MFLDIFKKQRPEGSIKIGVLKNLTKFTGKHLCWSFFFNKVAGLHLFCRTPLSDCFWSFKVVWKILESKLVSLMSAIFQCTGGSASTLLSTFWTLSKFISLTVTDFLPCLSSFSNSVSYPWVWETHWLSNSYWPFSYLTLFLFILILVVAFMESSLIWFSAGISHIWRLFPGDFVLSLIGDFIFSLIGVRWFSFSGAIL